MMKFVRNTFFILIVCMVLFSLTGCGGFEEDARGTDRPEYVEVTFQLVWENESDGLPKTRYAAGGYRYLTIDDLSTVTISVFDEFNNLLVNEDFDYIDHHARVKVRAGVNRKFVLEGKLISGEVISQGEKTGVTLTAGILNDIGQITMLMDTTPPQNPSISINNGASATISPSVALTISAMDNFCVTGYYVLEDPNISIPSIPSIPENAWVSITPKNIKSYQQIISYVLSGGYEIKTVYVWFRDGAENISTRASDNIEYVAEGPIPSPPANVNATAGDKQVIIRWDAVSNATSYNIYWSLYPGVAKTNGTKIANAATPYAHYGLTNDVPYYYVVTAENDYGESNESDEDWATPVSPAAPIGQWDSMLWDQSAWGD